MQSSAANWPTLSVATAILRCGPWSRSRARSASRYQLSSTSPRKSAGNDIPTDIEPFNRLLLVGSVRNSTTKSTFCARASAHHTPPHKIRKAQRCANGAQKRLLEPPSALGKNGPPALG